MCIFRSVDLEELEKIDRVEPKKVRRIVARLFVTARVAHEAGRDDKGERAYNLAKKFKQQACAEGINFKTKGPYSNASLERLRTTSPLSLTSNGRKAVRHRLRVTIARRPEVAEWAQILIKKFTRPV